ncbi:MAG TPA: aminoglycoside phosphotransferase family protein [Jatrophihabitans sp.]
MSSSPGRRVTLVLCKEGDGLLGSLPCFDVPTPHWQSVAEVVAGAQQKFGIEITVLRMLHADLSTTFDGGPVTYLAEVDARPDVTLARWPADPVVADPVVADPVVVDPVVVDPLVDDPRRASYARPGGPQADLVWAYRSLDAAGASRRGHAVQIRTWNLSSIWRIPTTDGGAWLKVVPSFFGHEGPLLVKLNPAVVPPIIATSCERILLGDVPGQDQYGATGEPLLEMVRLLLRLQGEWLGRTAELLDIGVPDWRPAVIVEAAAAVIDRTASRLDAPTRSTLRRLLAGLPQRFDALDSCGIPHTLVHGDFHPGNVRGVPGRFALIDWGDSGVGHPARDLLTFCSRLSEADRIAVEAEWCALWASVVPGCAPDRAAKLFRPIAALCGAITFQRLLDEIESDEHPYHFDDPPDCLRRAAAEFEREIQRGSGRSS